MNPFAYATLVPWVRTKLRNPGVALLATLIRMDMKLSPLANAFVRKVGLPSVSPSPVIVNVALLLGIVAPTTPVK